MLATSPARARAGDVPDGARNSDETVPEAPAPVQDSAPPPPERLTPPSPRETPVDYPEGATGDAEVVLEITVSVDGEATSASVLSGAPPFANAAVAAASTWRFEPARLGGRPVAARIRYTVRFQPAPEVKAGLRGAEPPARPTAAPTERSAPGAGPPAAPSPAAPGEGDPREVIVRGERQGPGSVTVTRGEARNLPGSFGDPLRAIEAQPGVVPIVSGAPSFFIRGAPPANVGFFIDGVDVPLLYHAFLGPSVIHPGLIESVDLYRGASPVEYGRFAGPIVAANVRPFEQRWNGEGNLRLIDVGGLVEAPFGECEAGMTGPCSRGSARIAGRYSYTGVVLSLLSDADLRYWDYQADVSYKVGRYDTISAFAFGAYDFFRANRDTDQDQGGKVSFHRIDLRWDRKLPSGTNLRVALTGGADRTGGTGPSESEVSGRSLRARLQMTTPLGSQATLRAGADARVDEFQLKTSPLYLRFPDYSVLFPARVEGVAGAYLGVDFVPAPGISVAPGVRTDIYSTGGTTVVGVDPRVNASFAVHPNVKIEHSFGLAHQRPNFAAQVPGAQVADLTGGLQQALLFSSGFRWKLPSSITVSATAFRTAYFDALDPIGGARDFSIDRTVLDRRSTIAAAGIELGIARALTRKVGGFISYTLSRSEQWSGRRKQVSGFDRPHVLQAGVSYDLGAGFRIGVRGVLYSGVPALNLEGFPHFSADHRGSPYLRVDGRFEKRWHVGKTGWWSATAEILNATSSKEVVRLDCGGVCVERFAGPVILPSVGIEAGF